MELYYNLQLLLVHLQAVQAMPSLLNQEFRSKTLYYGTGKINTLPMDSTQLVASLLLISMETKLQDYLLSRTLLPVEQAPATSDHMFSQ